MVDVVVDVARALDVLHEVDAARLQRPPDALQQRERARLVVDRVEGRHVRRTRPARRRRRTCSGRVARSGRSTALARPPGRARIRSHPPRGRIRGTCSSGSALRAAASACPRPHPRSRSDGAVVEPLGHPGDEREDVREQHREDGLRALLRHDLVEARVALVRNPSTRLGSTRRCRPRRSRGS